MSTRWLLGPLLAALMWSCSEDATAPAPAAPIPMDRVAAHLARICSCTGEGDDIPQVELFGDDFMSEADRVPLGSRFVIDLGPEIPKAELPLTPLHRALDDGFASGRQLSLSRATRRADLGRAFLRFAIEGVPDAGMLYVVDEASHRICCKSSIASMFRLRAVDSQDDVLGTSLARMCPCVGAAGAIADTGLIGPSVVLVDHNGNRMEPLDFGTPIPQDEMPLAALYRAVDDGSAGGQKLSLLEATRRRDLGRQLLLFRIEGELHRARIYVVDAASGNICCKGELSTYMMDGEKR